MYHCFWQQRVLYNTCVKVQNVLALEYTAVATDEIRFHHHARGGIGFHVTLSIATSTKHLYTRPLGTRNDATCVQLPLHPTTHEAGLGIHFRITSASPYHARGGIRDPLPHNNNMYYNVIMHHYSCLELGSHAAHMRLRKRREAAT